VAESSLQQKLTTEVLDFDNVMDSELSDTTGSYFNSADDFIKEMSRKKTFLLGPAASGKTCLMKIFAGIQSGSYIAKSTKLLPLYVPISTLRVFELDMDFPKKCVRALALYVLKGTSGSFSVEMEKYLLDAIKNGQVLFLFDGLDECPSSHEKSKLQRDISLLPMRCGVIITSRISGFAQSLDHSPLLKNFQIGRILPLSFESQQLIAEKRGVTDPNFSTLLHKHGELTKNHLLLSMFIYEFKDSKTIPDKRVVLYKLAFDTMINLFLTKVLSQTFTQESLGVKRDEMFEFLKRIASRLQTLRIRDFDITQIDAEPDLLKYWEWLNPFIVSGKFPLITEFNAKYRFSHLTFQEFLAALVWSHASPSSPLRVLQKKFMGGKELAFNTDLLKKYFVDPWYRETLLMTGGLMETSEYEKYDACIASIFARQIEMGGSIRLKLLEERGGGRETIGRSRRLSRLLSPRKVASLLDGLISTNEEIREISVKCIKVYRLYGEAREFLFKNLEQTESYIVKTISDIFERGNEEVLQFCVKNLHRVSIRSKVLQLFGHFAPLLGGMRYVDDILDSIDVKLEKETLILMETLGQITPRGYGPFVQTLIDLSSEWQFRDKGCELLGNITSIGSTSALDCLFKHAKDSSFALISFMKLCSPDDKRIVDFVIMTLNATSLIDVHDKLDQPSFWDNEMDPTALQHALMDLIGSDAAINIRTRAARCLSALVLEKDLDVTRDLMELANKMDPKVVQPVLIALGHCAPKDNRFVANMMFDMLELDNLTEKTQIALYRSLGVLLRRGNDDAMQMVLSTIEKHGICTSFECEFIEAVVPRGDKEILQYLLITIKETILDGERTTLGRFCLKALRDILLTIDYGTYALLDTVWNVTAQMDDTPKLLIRTQFVDIYTNIPSQSEKHEDKTRANLIQLLSKGEIDLGLAILCLQFLEQKKGTKEVPIRLYLKLLSELDHSSVDKKTIAYRKKILTNISTIPMDDLIHIFDHLYSDLRHLSRNSVFEMLSWDHKNFSTLALRTDLFSAIILRIRSERKKDSGFILTMDQIRILERIDQQTATFIIYENAQ
jgi:hypothetical protein